MRFYNDLPSKIENEIHVGRKVYKISITESYFFFFFCDNFIVTIRKNNLNLGRLKYSLYAILFFTYCGSYRIYVL